MAREVVGFLTGRAPSRRHRADPISEDELFLMANLFPEDTGLPMVVWISEKGGARHDARVKVARSHGSKARPDDTVSVSVREPPIVVAGEGLAAADLKLVQAWIELNRPIILDHWSGKISSRQAVNAIAPLPS